MCGFAGLLLNWPGSLDNSEAAAAQMADAIKMRGPDDAGTWSDPQAGIALSHRRLAIVDLSAAGHQPMTSYSGRFVMVFNGEIYNHEAFRQTLHRENVAPVWRGHSDTETLLAGFEAWGIEPTLKRCVGMFAIALWDRVERKLVLARDRFGEKPLYYGWVGRGEQRAFVFGSELKALRAYSGFDAPICRVALSQYFQYLYVPTPRSIYEGISKLEPGCCLTFSLSVGEQPQMTISPYWSLKESVLAARQHIIPDEATALSALENCLAESVRIQSLADVPLGAFLSGGVDSSIIAALMQQQSTRPVKTFTVGFDETGFDESPFAAAVAKHLGTEHHEIRVSAIMTREVIPLLPRMYDEPFADSSQIPTYLVCKAARRLVTVALSGDAGDELFGGYNRYVWGPRIWNKLRLIPFPIRRALGVAIRSVPLGAWDSLNQTLGVSRLSDKAWKLANGLSIVRGMDDLYWRLVSEWHAGESLVLGGADETEFKRQVSMPPALGAIEQMMYCDTAMYLPDDILCKVDRAAMSVSLETRVPFLDYRVAELAWRLPLSMKVQGSQGKWALRQILYNYVPRELIERPKAGFAIPIGQWLRGSLRDWAESLLDPSRLQSEGFLNSDLVRAVWTEHISGYRDHSAKLWAVLMFESWLQDQRRGV